MLPGMAAGQFGDTPHRHKVGRAVVKELQFIKGVGEGIRVMRVNQVEPGIFGGTVRKEARVSLNAHASTGLFIRSHNGVECFLDCKWETHFSPFTECRK